MIDPRPDPLPKHVRIATSFIAGTSCGGAAGAIACHLLLGQAPQGLAFLVALPVLMGVAMGASQWLALRDARPLPRAWIAATVGGWLVAPLFYIERATRAFDTWVPDEPSLWGLQFHFPQVAVPAVGSFAGIGAGILQALVASSIVRPRVLWIALSAAGHFLGGVMALLIGHALFGAVHELRFSLSGSPVQDVLDAAVPLAEPVFFGGTMALLASLTVAPVLVRPFAPRPATAPTRSSAPEPTGAPSTVRPAEPATP